VPRRYFGDGSGSHDLIGALKKRDTQTDLGPGQCIADATGLRSESECLAVLFEVSRAAMGSALIDISGRPD